MTIREEVETLVYKFGAIDVSRTYIRGIRSALVAIKNGVAQNNLMLATKDIEALSDNLGRLEVVYGLGDDTLKAIQHLEKDLK